MSLCHPHTVCDKPAPCLKSSASTAMHEMCQDNYSMQCMLRISMASGGKVAKTLDVRQANFKAVHGSWG
jgi:hypothetical protein